MLTTLTNHSLKLMKGFSQTVMPRGIVVTFRHMTHQFRIRKWPKRSKSALCHNVKPPGSPLHTLYTFYNGSYGSLSTISAWLKEPIASTTDAKVGQTPISAHYCGCPLSPGTESHFPILLVLLMPVENSHFCVPLL